MLPDSLTFVDIETTGTSVTYSRIIEIGILKVRNNKLIKKYNTLVNPQTTIDPFIEKFTGITQKDVESAPTFYDIKDDLLDILTDSVFVAHNVRFDYGFLRNEFKRYDITFSTKHFCTVKLAKLLYPGFQNYHLDSIITNFQIKCKRRHRAFDDAKVIWDFYRKSLKNIEIEKFIQAIKVVLRRPSVPLSISQEKLDSLPETPGVYIFYGEDGAPLYIGKSLNIKDRVLSHFSSDYLSGTDMKISQQIRSIDTLPTAGELGALFLESTLIKKHQPLYNRKLRLANKLLAVEKTKSDQNYNSIDISYIDEISPKDLDNIIGVFKSQKQLKVALHALAEEYQLCLKLLKLEKTKKYCFNYHLGKCRGACKGLENTLKYNLRFETAFYQFKIKSWPFAGPILIKEKANTEETLVFDKWCYLGNWKEDNQTLQSDYKFDYDTYKILLRYVSIEKNLRNITTFTPPTSYPS